VPIGRRSLPVDPDDLEHGIRFIHDLAMNALGTADRVELVVDALVSVLVAHGIVDKNELASRIPWPEARPRQAYQPAVEVKTGVAGKHSIESPPIDCVSLLPICKARCCRLTVHLAYEDVADGFDWVFERPYELRRDRGTGYCTNHRADSGCARYHARPGTCRAFDCRNDMRIWADFDNKIPAPIELTDDRLIQIRKR
jgi:hypothetical protein